MGEELHDALTQRSGGVARSYGDGLGLKALAEAIVRRCRFRPGPNVQFDGAKQWLSNR
jgi:hypothetical protein